MLLLLLSPMPMLLTGCRNDVFPFNSFSSLSHQLSFSLSLSLRSPFRLQCSTRCPDMCSHLSFLYVYLSRHNKIENFLGKTVFISTSKTFKRVSKCCRLRDSLPVVSCPVVVRNLSPLFFFAVYETLATLTTQTTQCC